MKKQSVIVYHDELNEEFAFTQKKDVKVGGDFVYIKRGIIRRLAKFFVYRVIMTPVAFLHCKLKFGLKIVGKEKPKGIKGGFFVYGNHTLQAGDAFIPNVALFPKTVYIVVKSANISTFGTKNFIMLSGALPIPTEFSGMRNFLSALKTRIDENSAVMIYPEAHIWPYYTDIRPFKATSFSYPVKFCVPAFSSTVVYKKRKFLNRPKITVYIDGPFYPDETIGEKERVQKLRDDIYAVMKGRAKSSDCEYIKYVKAEEDK